MKVQFLKSRLSFLTYNLQFIINMYTLTLFAALAAAGVNAMPNNLFARQAVTSKISPTASAPSGCIVNYSGSFGIAVMNITTSLSSSASATESASVTESAPSSETAAITQSSE